MITVVLLGVLAAMAAPSLESTLGRFRVRTGAEALVSGLQLARSEALRRNQPVRFRLTAGAANWAVETLSPTTTIQETSGRSLSGVTIATNAGQGNLVFLSSGMVDTSVARLERIDVGSSVAGVGGWRVEVHGGGQIRLCDQSVTDANDPRKC